MNEISAAARALAVILSIISAFITVPLTAPLLLVFGGAAMDGPRHIWWNFVSSRKERIDQAKADWAAGHFQKVPGDEIEFIPLPER